ncbi:MAG: hypothetical protein AB7K86_13165 [Rhodospirillales bacterium]
MKSNSLFRRIVASDAPRVEAVPVEISPGALIDRITLLEVEVSFGRDPALMREATDELERLHAAREKALPDCPALDRLVAEMKQINARACDIGRRLRAYEAEQDFGPDFIALARAVQRASDRRAAIRERINALLGARVREARSYA